MDPSYDPQIHGTLKFVNLWQSKEERQAKYWLCRSTGRSSSWASKMRDWNLTTIEQFLGLTPSKHKHNQPLANIEATIELNNACRTSPST